MILWGWSMSEWGVVCPEWFEDMSGCLWWGVWWVS